MFISKTNLHFREILSGASVAFALKIFAAGIGFSFNVILARLLGAEDAGLYYLSLTCVTMAAVLGRIGLDNTVIRFIAANAVAQNWVAVKGVYTKGIFFVFMASSITAIILIGSAGWISKNIFSKPELTILIRWMAIAIVPFALFTIHSNALQGLKKIRDAVTVLSVFLPLFSFIGILFLVPIWGVFGAIWAYIFSAYITLLISILVWRKSTPNLREISGKFQTKKILESSLPLFWMSLLNLVIIWSSNIMLGMWRSSAEVAIYSAANRTAMLTSFTLVAVNTIAAPKFAALYKQGDIKNLSETVKNCAKLMTIMASPVLVIFLFFPEKILSLFGTDFVQGALALKILAIGQFVNVVTGSVGYLLMMCGYERSMRNIIASCAILNIILNSTLIPFYGTAGAAMATAITLSVQYFFGVVTVWKNMGIMSIPIGAKNRKLRI